MRDYTTKATVELDVNGQKAKAELEQQRKLVKDLEIAYAKAEASGDKSAKTIHKELNKARRGLKSMQSATISAADVLRRLDKATPKELKNTLRQLNKELNSIPRGTKAWDEHVQKIRTVKKEVENVNASLDTQKTRWQRLSDWINKWQTMAVAAFAVVMKGISSAKSAVNAYADMDSAMANTQKFTGMAREQVELLNEEFKKMDTRTSREGLNELAQEAGRLGKTSQEDILGFVRAADKINVALDDLGEGATLTISKLTGIFGDEERLGTERSLLAVGSVINEISQNCAASAPYLAEFTSRMGGVGAQANMTIPQIMAYGAVLDSNNQTVEASATAVSQVIVRMMQNPAKYAKVAGIEVQKFCNLLKTDVNGALILFLEKLNQAGTLDVLSPMFADMGENGSRAISALSTLANKIEDVKTRQQEAAIAFAEATSVDKEFNVQNNTVQAGLDKAKKSFNELKVELGEQLMPVMKYMISGTSAMMHVLSTVVHFVKNNIGLITTLTATVLAYSVAANAAAIKTKLLVLWQGIAKTAMVTWRTVTLLGAATMALFTKNSIRASAAIRLLNNTVKMSPIGLFISIITAGIGLLITFSSKTSKAKSAMELLAESQKRLADAEKEAEASCAAEIIQLDALYNATQNQTLAMEERINAVKKLQQQYPEYFGSLSQEAILAGNAANEYARLRNNILSSAKARARQEMVVENEKEIAKLTREMDVKFKELMSKYSMPEAYANIIKQAGYDYYKFIDQARITPTSYFISDWNEIIDKYDPQIAQLQSDQKVLAELIAKDSIDAANNTPGDNVFNPTTDSRFDAENQWRKTQEEIAKASYRNQEVNYEEHQKKMNEIATEYNEKLLKRNDLTDSERETILDDYHKAQKGTTTTLPPSPVTTSEYDKIKMEYKTLLTELEQARDAAVYENSIDYYNGNIDYESYVAEKERIDTEYYENRINLMSMYAKMEGDAQLLYAKEISGELLKLEAERAEHIATTNKAKQKRTLEDYKNEYEKEIAALDLLFNSPSSLYYGDKIAQEEQLFRTRINYLTKCRDIYNSTTREYLDYQRQIDDAEQQRIIDRRKVLMQSYEQWVEKYTSLSGKRRYELEMKIVEELYTKKMISEEQYQLWLAELRKKYAQETNEAQANSEKARYTVNGPGGGSIDIRPEHIRIQANVNKLKTERDDAIAELKKRLEGGLITEEEFGSGVDAINKKYTEELFAPIREMLDEQSRKIVDLGLTWANFFKSISKEGKLAFSDIADVAKATVGSLCAGLETYSKFLDAEKTIELATVEKRYDREIELAEGNSYKMAKAEKKKEEETQKIKSEYAKKEFAIKVIMAVAQTAQNALMGYAAGLQAGFPMALWLAPTLAGLAAAQGAIQIALLKKQQQAAEAQGYSAGGFTKPGAVNEPAGIVHAGEWVASQRLLANPQARAVIEMLDYAQRTNTIGSLRSADVSRSIRANDTMTRIAEGDNGSALLVAAVAQMSRAATDLNTRLNEPFVTINTVSGDHGIKRAQDEYSKLIANKTSKSKRKNATNN